MLAHLIIYLVVSPFEYACLLYALYCPFDPQVERIIVIVQTNCDLHTRLITYIR